jgi:nucleoside-diphosphate-sugar epimerase
MKVFVAGATGAIGRQLVPMLVQNGHEVVGMTRSESKRELLTRLGARPVVGDGLDAEAVGQAVSQAQPEVVVHELTAIPAALDMRRIERDFAATNRLRTEGTDHLLSAARAAGARRFVAQSFASYYQRTGGWIKTEDDPLDPDAPAAIRPTIERDPPRRASRDRRGLDRGPGPALRRALRPGDLAGDQPAGDARRDDPRA